jgi:NADH:ubiquinone reductase (H+-translocating)
MRHTKIVVIGGGFGGLNVVKGLKKTRQDLLLIDRTNHHLFQPLLYQIASAALSPADIAIPLREILRNQDNASVIMGDVVEVDKKNKQITMFDGEKIGYDFLVIAVGARHSYFGNDRWEKFAPGLKTLQDAIQIRQQVLLSFEKAERLEDLSESHKYLNFVVIGAGPTGVEMAGAIAEIAYQTMFKNFRRINPALSKIYLIEALPYILPMYSHKLSLKAKKDLEKLGVIVINGNKVTDVAEDGVQIQGEFIESVNLIWAAGNQASPLLKTLDVPLDRQGRVKVESDLSIPGHPEIFVIGDAACALGKDGQPLPGIAPTAIQQAKYLVKILSQEVPKNQRSPFRYFDKGSMATIGKFKAVAKIGRLEFSGFLAWAAWCFIHILYLIGFSNRVTVMMQWSIMYFTSKRGVRLIYRPIDEQHH